MACVLDDCLLRWTWKRWSQSIQTLISRSMPTWKKSFRVRQREGFTWRAKSDGREVAVCSSLWGQVWGLIWVQQKSSKIFQQFLLKVRFQTCLFEWLSCELQEIPLKHKCQRSYEAFGGKCLTMNAADLWMDRDLARWELWAWYINVTVKKG